MRVPRKAESDCSRIKSMGAEEGVTVFVEVEDVTVTPSTWTLKLMIEGCVGRVSATNVKLRLAVPPVPPPVPPPPPPPEQPVTTLHPLRRPLQPARDKTARERMGRNERALLPRMRHPTIRLSALSFPGKENAHDPIGDCNANGRADGPIKAAKVFNF